MKFLAALSLSICTLLFVGCQTSPSSVLKQHNVETSGPIEISEFSQEHQSDVNTSVIGVLIDEYDEPLIGGTVQVEGTMKGAACDLDGTFRINEIDPGEVTLLIKYIGAETSRVTFTMNMGDQVRLKGRITYESNIQTEKPVIYLYPEEKMEVHVGLVYDGKITTTYPKLPKKGWKVEAEPDGTLTDQNGREYYSLYWEGEPRKPLGMSAGFVVAKDETIEFLEEKLEFLGLNAKEANEFIIYWLPALEKNKFNLISFAGEDYLNQAKLNITPKPDTEIRICMIFQGLDTEINFPLQDLTPLKKARKGFTIVEWGGQQLRKGFESAI